MKNLSLNGILDSRWTLKEIGNGNIKLCYESVKGIPSIHETNNAIRKVMQEKGLTKLYISGEKGDVLVNVKDLPKVIERENNISKNKKFDILSTPFGSEDDLILKEDIGLIR